MTRPAVFLDRDDTLIEDRGYIGNPDDVRLVPGAAEAVRRLSEAGYLVVVVSNQSGIARGLFDEDDLAAVHSRFEALLRESGAALDAAYYCPYLDGDAAKVEEYRRNSELRKPKPGMLLKAADDLDIDLARSWMVGDSDRDVEAGRCAGCRTVLVRKADERSNGTSEATHVAATVLDAARILERDMTRSTQQEHAGERSREALGGEPAGQRDLLQALNRLHDQLERQERRARQEDFSLFRLFGALLQMFAIVAGVWGLMSLVNEQFQPATARLLLATFLQAASASVFLIDRSR